MAAFPGYGKRLRAERLTRSDRRQYTQDRAGESFSASTVPYPSKAKMHAIKRSHCTDPERFLPQDLALFSLCRALRFVVGHHFSLIARLVYIALPRALEIGIMSTHQVPLFYIVLLLCISLKFKVHNDYPSGDNSFSLPCLLNRARAVSCCTGVKYLAA